MIFLCILIIDCGLQLPDPDPDHQFPAPILLRRHHIFSHAGTLLPLVGSFNQSIQGLTCHSFDASPSLNHCRYAAALVKILQPSRNSILSPFGRLPIEKKKTVAIICSICDTIDFQQNARKPVKYLIKEKLQTCQS